MHPQHSLAKYGRVPEWPKGADCKSASSAFGGSNPPPSTKKTKHERKSPVFRFFDRQEVDEQDFCKKNLVREPTRSVSSKGCRNAGNRYPLSATILIYKFIANYANQCHVLYYHTARNIILIIEKHAKTISLSVFFGLPERARTADLGSRSPVCYPTAPQVVKVRSSHLQ